ncbi:MAG: MMPL family transporter [Candidatus Thermoplasmatota archaeon]|nr:MMPL family transporter [Candidatus Thermoplasmatota archaeon]
MDLSFDDDGGESRNGKSRGGPYKKNPRRIFHKDEATDVEETLDRVVTEISDKTPIYGEKAKSFLIGTGKRIRDLDEEAGGYTQRMFRSKPLDMVMEVVLRWRKTIFAVVVVLSLLLGYFGVIGTDFLKERKLLMQDKIRGDFEVYLPGGSDAERVIFEMQKDWSTDLATVMVETQNKFDPTDETNITDYDVLKEISNIEEELNHNKTDKGREDGVVFCFSISTIIKTLNHTTTAVEEAFFNELPRDLIPISLPDQFKGNYSIPPDQRLIDEFFFKAGPNSISSLVADVNGDGIYDSALILMGLSKEVDQAELIDRIDELIFKYFVDAGVRPGSVDTTDDWLERYGEGEVHCRMTLTGPTPLARMISDRTMKEMQKVLPWALAMVAASLLIFHRTWKILIITLVPVMFSLIIAYGLMGLFLNVLTPQVVLVAPILIALGVAYGLYIANRYAEEESIEDKEKRIRYALRTTGKAIFLSAMTTAFGFGAMLTVDMATMQVLGFGLASGIVSCYLTTILMTPSLVIWLDYKKLSKGKDRKPTYKTSGARRMGNIPMNHSRKILVAGILFAIVSMALSPPSSIPGTGLKVGGFSVVRANMDYIALSPADEPVVQKMAEQSDTFGSGQIGLMIVRGESAFDMDGDDRDDLIVKSLKDYNALIDIDKLTRLINGDGNSTGIENADAISIVDVMKMIGIPDFTDSESYQYLLDSLRKYGDLWPNPITGDPVTIFDEWVKSNVVGHSFWEAMGNVPDNVIINTYLGEDLSVFFMNIFYNSLGQEIRGMLINDSYAKTVIYIMMPNMDIIDTEKVVNQVDSAINSKYNVKVGEEGGKPTASPLSGFGKVLVTVNNVIVDNANQSTIIALILVFLLLFLVFKSWRIALITVLPVSLVVFWQYAAIWGIGALGDIIAPGEKMFSGDLNLFTALIGSIIIGIGVDFSIHITERIREKNFTLEGIMYATDTSGWSFIEATVTMVMGLTAVFLVNIPSIREFILLIIILLIFSAYSAIFILTSAYRLYLPRYNKLKSLKRIKG